MTPRTEPMTPRAEVRVLIADDHALTLEGLRTLLEEEPDMRVVGSTGDGAEVIPLASAHQPDVVLLDLGLGAVEGVDLIDGLKRLPDPPRVLVLTAYNDGETLRSAFDAGADGLSFKTEPPERTISAIREVQAGRIVFPEAARRWFERRRTDQAALTPREHEVWALVAQGLSNRDIGKRLHIRSNTVKYHLQNLFLKLGVSNRTEAATQFVAQRRTSSG